ncbi:MAG: helix-turn-helix domain-containing protein [Oligoflexia bacterium]|nr:helix-turn-helix domain-containing protein [Oligoflexia bacterium]
MKKNKGWVSKKLEDPKFKKKFQEESYKLSVAEQLTKLRKESGLTQAAVAKKIGTTASAISRYESVYYDKYELNTIMRIVEACGGTLKIIIGSKHSFAKS